LFLFSSPEPVLQPSDVQACHFNAAARFGAAATRDTHTNTAPHSEGQIPATLNENPRQLVLAIQQAGQLGPISKRTSGCRQGFQPLSANTPHPPGSSFQLFRDNHQQKHRQETM